MLGGIKRFIKSSLLTPEHPFFWSLNSRRLLAKGARHSRMTYAEIESAIGSQHRKIFGRTLNWENPQTFNEKIHVAALYMPDPIKTRLADKVAVREWITELIGSEYLIPLLGVYDSFDEIDFDALPDSFVIKCSHDSGSVTLVKDKSKINRDSLMRKYHFFMKRNYAWPSWEMQYRDIPPKIIIEQYIENADVNDYRFFCFGGKPYFCAVDFHNEMHKICARNFYSMNWERMPFALNYPNYNEDVPCPENLEAMKSVAEKLSDGIDQVRVDLYCIDSHIYNGEMTFSHAGGSQKFTPDEWDYKLGELWPFDNTIRAKVLAQSSRP